ncbi:unnamed protein product [Dicrocoelium dendriticum]|nr:unnamed protein product [Dicrocoelium dendriticum]
MRLFTPEIAWHETLPVYSCDLQLFTGSRAAGSCKDTETQVRSPLTELSSFDSGAHSHASTDRGWTRLATAGGDNIVRLWRIRLDWITLSASQVASSIGATVSKKNVDCASLSQLTHHLAYLASLKRHEKPVNVVRWSPSGDYLASAGDDLFVIIWSYQGLSVAAAGSTDKNEPDAQSKDDDEDDLISHEHWVPCRSLRRHLEDIYDLCWSPDNQTLVSGSVDHSVIVWQLNLAPVVRTSSPTKSVGGEGTIPSIGSSADASVDGPSAPPVGPGNTKCLIIRDHKHYVQGVAWDPLGFYMASLSSDRACRIYRAGTRNCLAHVSKANKQRLFQDDSWKSFFRRLAFSPDGLLLVCPSGNLEQAPFADTVTTVASLACNTSGPSPHANAPSAQFPVVTPQHAAHVFVRTNFVKPVVSLPTGPRPVVTVRFCPQPFQLRVSPSAMDPESARPHSLFDLPYRWLFCLVLEDGLLFYDTQQTVPFAQVSQTHYQALNDATWSADGHLVVTCSTDGYCSLVHFARGELGAVYRGPTGSEALRCSSALPKKPTDFEPPVSVRTDEQSTTAKSALLNGLHNVTIQDSGAHNCVSIQPVSQTGEDEVPTTGSMKSVPGTPKKRRVPFTTLSTESGAPFHLPKSPSASAVSSTDSRNTSRSSVSVGEVASEAAATKSLERKRRVSFVTLDSQSSGPFPGFQANHPVKSGQPVSQSREPPTSQLDIPAGDNLQSIDD